VLYDKDMYLYNKIYHKIRYIESKVKSKKISIYLKEKSFTKDDKDLDILLYCIAVFHTTLNKITTLK